MNSIVQELKDLRNKLSDVVQEFKVVHRTLKNSDGLLAKVHDQMRKT